MGATFSVGPKTYGDPLFFINPPLRNTIDGYQTIYVPNGWSYTSSDTNVATIYSYNYISIGNAGTTTINATGTEWFGDGATQVRNIDTTLIVNKKNPTLYNFSIETKKKGTTFTIPPPISDSPGTFSYTVVYGNAVTISGTSATTTTADNVTIRAIQAETTNYGSSSIDTTFTVINKTSSLTSTKSTAIINKFTVNGSVGFDFFSTDNTDGGYVRSYSSSNPNVLSIPNSSIASGTIVGSGSVTISANQTETVNFDSILVSNIITIVIIGNNSTYSSLDMTNVDLSGSNLSSTIFSNCNMTNANLFGTTVNSNTDLRNVTTLQSLRSGRINGVTALLPSGYNMI